MPFEYEALVGQLYVVGGRSISTAPPGALVEIAPLNAARGREADTFFSLVLPSGDALAPSAFYERMAQTAAEHYFESTGSVTAGIRETIEYLNRNLLEFNQAHPEKTYEANLLCAVLRGDDLILGRVGSGVVVYYHQGKCETLPADLANDEALFGPPLGVQAVPEVKLSRHRVATGTRLILSDANLADFTGVQLNEAVEVADISLAIVALKELARLQLSLLAIEFVPPEGSVPTSVPVREGASTFEIAEAQRQEAAKAKSRQTDTLAAGRRSPLGKTGEQLVERSQIGLARGASAAAQALSLSNRTIEHYFGSPVDGKRRFPIPIATGLVILVPVLVVSLVVALWIAGSGESAFEQCLNRVLTYADSARLAANSSPNNRIQLWDVTIEAAVDCQPLRPDDASLGAIITEAQLNIDNINQVARRNATQLQPVISGAVLDRIVLAGLNMYLLDKTHGIVYRASLSQEDGLSYSQRPAPIPSMTIGASVEGYVIDGMVDIAFSEQDDAITLLTTGGVMVQCQFQFDDCEAQELLNWEEWQTPLRITFFGEQRNFYVLDPSGNQIWRYEQSSGQYVTTGVPYFDGVNRDSANVTNAVDFSIDGDGLVYVLLSDGNIQKYSRGEIQPFEYRDIPESQTLDSAQSMFLNDAPTDRAIYIADQRNRTIFEFGFGGTRRATYRIVDEQLFNSLSGVAASSQVIYAISGNSVFALQKRPPE